MTLGENKSNILPALIKVQQSMKPIKKDGRGYNYKYISFDLIMGALRPLLAENELFLTQNVGGYIENGVNVITCQTTIYHSSGESVSSDLMSYIPKGQKVTDKATKSFHIEEVNMRDLGSAITYSKRYQLNALLGIVADLDDDGQAVSTLLGEWGVTISKEQKAIISDILTKNPAAKEKYSSVFSSVTNKTKTDDLSQDEAQRIIEKLREM